MTISHSKRSVRFNQTPDIIIQKHREYKKRELWYCRKELKRIRSEIRCARKNLSVAASSAEDTFDWRGLEHVQKGTVCTMIQSRQSLVQGVMNVQKLHKLLGLHNDDGLRVFASAYNKTALERARSLAMTDQDIATKIYWEPWVSR